MRGAGGHLHDHRHREAERLGSLEIERYVLALMDEFTIDSSADTDRRNFETLKDMHKELMSRTVAGEFGTEKFSPFLRNFLEEFDNTYASGLPEAIIKALKSGKRANLTKEWWEKNAPER